MVTTAAAAAMATGKRIRLRRRRRDGRTVHVVPGISASTGRPSPFGAPSSGDVSGAPAAGAPAATPADPFLDGPPPPEWDGFSGEDDFDPGAMGGPDDFGPQTASAAPSQGAGEDPGPVAPPAAWQELPPQQSQPQPQGWGGGGPAQGGWQQQP